VSTFESAYRLMPRIGAQFDLLVVDEAHHFLPAPGQPAKESVPPDLSGVVAVTARPRELSRPFLERLEAVIAVGPDADVTVADFCAARGLPRLAPLGRPMQKGEALLWREGQKPLWFRLAQPGPAHQRHATLSSGDSEGH